MKKIISVIIFLISINAFSQVNTQLDSIDVRVCNGGKHYLKEYIVTINGKNYVFSDIRKNKYSVYQKLPYIWNANKSKTTVIIKRLIKYDEWMTALTWPIDHIGDKKLISGKYSIEVKAKRKGDQLEIEENIKKEK